MKSLTYHGRSRRALLATMVVSAGLCISNLLATSTVAQTPARGGALEAWQPSDWQPRPLALPRTSDSVPAWKPPQSTPQPKKPAEPQAVVRPRKAISLDEPSVMTKPSRPARPMPAPDPINQHARTAELAQSAIDQLRNAHFAAQRGAFHSAKESATQTLKIIAALRDSRTGGNTHTMQLNEAITAIRESTDFTGRYGPVDHAALTRLVDVHQTPVLQGVDTSGLTAARAIEIYLNYARMRWVEATMDGPLAAEATMILANLESSAHKTTGGPDATESRTRLHASELALMYRRAAVEIGPDNPRATAELGRNLLSRSMPDLAKELLLLSVQQSPTRQSVEDLMQAASQAGDANLAAQCQHSLATTALPSELPITVLSPDQFAKTHRQTGSPQAATRIATRPPNVTQPKPPTNVMNSAIVDPSMPSKSSSQRSGLFW